VEGCVPVQQVGRTLVEDLGLVTNESDSPKVTDTSVRRAQPCHDAKDLSEVHSLSTIAMTLLHEAERHIASLEGQDEAG